MPRERERRLWYWVLVRFVSDRELNLIIVLFCQFFFSKAFFHFYDILNFIQKPQVDLCDILNLLQRDTAADCLSHYKDTYPIAKVSAKIALGYHLDEIKNAITGKTYASFEPALDYCVVKIPRLPFDKFIKASRKLTTQMKATGEVMSICTNFEGALMKALRSLEQHVNCLIYEDMNERPLEEIRCDLCNHLIRKFQPFCLKY